VEAAKTAAASRAATVATASSVKVLEALLVPLVRPYISFGPPPLRCHPTWWHPLVIVAGVAAVLAMTSDIARALVVPRSGSSRISRGVMYGVDQLFWLLCRTCSSYKRRDAILALQGPVLLLVRLLAWLAGYEAGFALVLWPSVGRLPLALEQVASSMFTLGFVYTRSGAPTAVDVVAAAAGIGLLSLQVAYLPTLYSAFNRRETEVTLLGARAGNPPWGPELLARARYGGAAWTEDLPELYATWERWAADVAESHSNYSELVWFRSPKPLTSWVIALLAVMDSAAMLLAVAPSRERREARLALRAGFTAMYEIAQPLGLVPGTEPDPDPNGEIELSFEKFSAAFEQLAEVGFPLERSAAEAWPDFRGWRVNYEPVAYALARATDSVPAPWSGPRRWPAETIVPHRPASRLPHRPGEPRPPARVEGDGVPAKGASAR